MFFLQKEIQIAVYRSLPSPAGKGDREAVDEESGTQFGVGCRFFLVYQGVCHTRIGKLNPLSSSVTR